MRWTARAPSTPRRVSNVPEEVETRAPCSTRTVPFLAPFVTVLREVQEMRYLWTTDVRLDNCKLVAFLGQEPKTPILEALRETLAFNGCLPANATGAGDSRELLVT